MLDLGGGKPIGRFFERNIKHTLFALGGKPDQRHRHRAAGAIAEAEKIKLKDGSCLAQHINSDETIEIPGMGGAKPRKLHRQILVKSEPRMK